MAETALVRSRLASAGVGITWFFRLLLAFYFLTVGSRKLLGAAMWVAIFEHIGAGQWFHYVTGVIQILGAVLLLIPRTFMLGTALLACTMVGAMLAWTFVLGEPRSAVLPALVLSILLTLTIAVRRSG